MKEVKVVPPDTSSMFLEQRVKRLEEFCAGLFEMLYNKNVRSAQRHEANFNKLKAEHAASKKRRSLRKQRPVKKPRK